MFALALALPLFSAALVDDGVGPVEPNAVIAELDAGTHWFGAPFDPQAAVGKVTLVSYWGS